MKKFVVLVALMLMVIAAVWTIGSLGPRVSAPSAGTESVGDASDVASTEAPLVAVGENGSMATASAGTPSSATAAVPPSIEGRLVDLQSDLEVRALQGDQRATCALVREQERCRRYFDFAANPESSVLAAPKSTKEVDALDQRIFGIPMETVATICSGGDEKSFTTSHDLLLKALNAHSFPKLQLHALMKLPKREVSPATREEILRRLVLRGDVRASQYLVTALFHEPNLFSTSGSKDLQLLELFAMTVLDRRSVAAGANPEFQSVIAEKTGVLGKPTVEAYLADNSAGLAHSESPVASRNMIANSVIDDSFCDH